MTQEHIIKLLTGASQVIRQTSKLINEKSSNYIDNNFIKGNYVAREEFEQLRKLVLKLEKIISSEKSSKEK